MNKESNEQVSHSTSPQDIFGDDWQTLTQDWQAQPYKKSDIDKLLKRTKRRTFWAKALIWLNVIATIFIIGMTFVIYFYNDAGIATVSYLGLMSVVFVYYEIKIRKATWKRACESPERAVDNAIRSCTSSLRYIRLIKIFYWAFVVIIIVFTNELSKEIGESFWQMLIEMLILVAICYGVTHWFQRKRLAELARLKQMKSK